MEQEKKAGWGGARKGAGRKRLDPGGGERRKHSVYVTKEELIIVRDFLSRYRTAKAEGEKEVRYPVE